jgi:hypothetical protein
VVAAPVAGFGAAALALADVLSTDLGPTGDPSSGSAAAPAGDASAAAVSAPAAMSAAGAPVADLGALVVQPDAA